MNATRLALLRELESFGEDNDARAAGRWDRMLNITPDTGEFLALLVEALRARRVLEVGTSNGYSTLWLADAVESLGGRLTTVDFLAAKADLASRNVERAGLTASVEQRVADAGEFLASQASGRFDLVFLDADRSYYLAWWPLVQAVLAPGGLLVTDNAVSHAAEMEPFMQSVRATPGYRTSLVPVGNGEFLALKPRT